VQQKLLVSVAAASSEEGSISHEEVLSLEENSASDMLPLKRKRKRHILLPIIAVKMTEKGKRCKQLTISGIK
jgi:hypothetical protein